MGFMYRVRKRRTLTNRAGKVIGHPGELFPVDDEDCKRNPSAVRLVEVVEPERAATDTSDIPGQTFIEDIPLDEEPDEDEE